MWVVVSLVPVEAFAAKGEEHSTVAYAGFGLVAAVARLVAFAAAVVYTLFVFLVGL